MAGESHIMSGTLPADRQHVAVFQRNHREGHGHLSPEMKKKVIHDNAAALYALYDYPFKGLNVQPSKAQGASPVFATKLSL
jgi:hypothetical protein